MSRLYGTGLASEVITDKARMLAELERLSGGDAGAAGRFMNVWHGSPHAFDKFSLDYMGTGEGTQAYGWGLYFTDLEDIARRYAVELAQRANSPANIMVFIDGEEIGMMGESNISNQAKDNIRIYASKKSGNLEAMSKHFEDDIAFYKARADAISLFGATDIDYERSTMFFLRVAEKALEILSTSKITISDLHYSNLYEVKVHGDKTVDELNFIRWDKPLSADNLKRIADGLGISKQELLGKTEVYEIPTGKEMYDVVRLDVFTTPKEASQFLFRVGIDGIQFPTGYKSKGCHDDSYNYVVFDDGVIDMVDKIRLMATPTGEVYGFTSPNGEVFLDPEHMNANTPIHEFAHLYLDVIKRDNRLLFDRLLESAKHSTRFEDLGNHPYYSRLSEDERAEEVVAFLVGNRGEERYFTEENRGWLDKFRLAVSDMYSWIKERMFGAEPPPLVRDMSPEDFSLMSFGDLVDKMAKDLLSGRQIGQPEISLTQPSELDAVNDRFNRKLQEHINGALKPGHVYNLGFTSAILRSTGIPATDVEFYAPLLDKKSKQANHPFDLTDMKDLPNVVQKPLAIFKSVTQSESFVILTVLRQNDKNYVVALKANYRKGSIFVNNIRSIYPRDSRQIANWIVKSGILLYTDKNGMADWISKQRCNSADVRNLFSQALNKIMSFQNPKLPIDNITNSNPKSKKNIKKASAFATQMQSQFPHNAVIMNNIVNNFEKINKKDKINEFSESGNEMSRENSGVDSRATYHASKAAEAASVADDGLMRVERVPLDGVDDAERRSREAHNKMADILGKLEVMGDITYSAEQRYTVLSIASRLNFLISQPRKNGGSWKVTEKDENWMVSTYHFDGSQDVCRYVIDRSGLSEEYKQNAVEMLDRLTTQEMALEEFYHGVRELFSEDVGSSIGYNPVDGCIMVSLARDLECVIKPPQAGSDWEVEVKGGNGEVYSQHSSTNIEDVCEHIKENYLPRTWRDMPEIEADGTLTRAGLLGGVERWLMEIDDRLAKGHTVGDLEDKVVTNMTKLMIESGGNYPFKPEMLQENRDKLKEIILKLGREIEDNDVRDRLGRMVGVSRDNWVDMDKDANVEVLHKNGGKDVNKEIQKEPRFTFVNNDVKDTKEKKIGRLSLETKLENLKRVMNVAGNMMGKVFSGIEKGWSTAMDKIAANNIDPETVNTPKKVERLFQEKNIEMAVGLREAIKREFAAADKKGQDAIDAVGIQWAKVLQGAVERGDAIIKSYGVHEPQSDPNKLKTQMAHSVFIGEKIEELRNKNVPGGVESRILLKKSYDIDTVTKLVDKNASVTMADYTKGKSYYEVQGLSRIHGCDESGKPQDYYVMDLMPRMQKLPVEMSVPIEVPIWEYDANGNRAPKIDTGGQQVMARKDIVIREEPVVLFTMNKDGVKSPRMENNVKDIHGKAVLVKGKDGNPEVYSRPKVEAWKSLSMDTAKQKAYSMAHLLVVGRVLNELSKRPEFSRAPDREVVKAKDKNMKKEDIRMAM